MAETAAFGGVPFSSRVRQWLEYGEIRVGLSHVEPTRIIARAPVDLPPGEGVVVVGVNGQEFRRAVFLDDGMNQTDTDTRIRPHDSIPF